MRRLACLLAGHLPLTRWLDPDGRAGFCPRCLQTTVAGAPCKRLTDLYP